MIDMHSHALFGVDDGPETIEESVQMLEAAIAAGFDEIVLTPHYMPHGKWQPDMETIQYNFDFLNRVKDKLGLPVKLYLGSEINYSYFLPDLICENKYKNYADNCYFLLETERRGASAEALIQTVKRFNDLGFSCILAHPERYDFIQDEVEVLEDFIKEGCLIQSNYLSLIDYYKKPTKDTLIQMLNKGYVHTLGSDAHQSEGYELYSKAQAIGKSVAGPKYWKEITEDNPYTLIHENKRIIPERHGIKTTYSSSLGNVDLSTILP